MLIIVVNSGIGYAGLSIAKIRPVRIYYTATQQRAKEGVFLTLKMTKGKRGNIDVAFACHEMLSISKGEIIANRQKEKPAFSLDSLYIYGKKCMQPTKSDHRCDKVEEAAGWPLGYKCPG